MTTTVLPEATTELAPAPQNVPRILPVAVPSLIYDKDGIIWLTIINNKYCQLQIQTIRNQKFK